MKRASSSGEPPAVAFFDVDETLISVKSMFDFLDYFLAARGLEGEDRTRVVHRIRDELKGLDRGDANRRFYSCFTGARESEVAELGRKWFRDRVHRTGFFHADVLAALNEHRRVGDLVVLVSGSFTACLDPISSFVGAHETLCTTLHVVDGTYDGVVTRAMIGREKAKAAARVLVREGVTAARCHAYGDHPSDLDLLGSVGYPVVVGANSEMTTIARSSGWARLGGVATQV